MDTLTERLERLAELQKRSLEPLQSLSGDAFAVFERMARKNYELMGDMVEYAVVQSRGPFEHRAPQELYEYQMAEARAFAERMSVRAAEYLALAEAMREALPKGVQAAPPTSDRGGEALPGGGGSGSSSAAGGARRRVPVTAAPDSGEGTSETPAATASKAVTAKRSSTGDSEKRTTSRSALAKKSAAKKSTVKGRSTKKAAKKATSSRRASDRKRTPSGDAAPAAKAKKRGGRSAA